MNKQISIKEALNIWTKFTPLPQDHLDMQTLYQFSLPKGLENASEYDIRHLSLCPKCLGEWKILCDLDSLTQTDDDIPETDETIFSFGLVQAASSGFTEPAFIQSECHKFMLGVFPQVDDPQKAMIVLETTDAEKNHTGMSARVTDANGRVILNTAVKQGRAAGKIECLDDIDLSTWSIVLSKSRTTESHE